MEEIKNITFSNIKILKEIHNSIFSSCKNYEDINPPSKYIKKNFIFNINGKNVNLKKSNDIKSYIYINSNKKKLNLNNLGLLTEENKINSKRSNKNGEYYLPVLISKKSPKEKFRTLENDLSVKAIKPFLNKSNLIKNKSNKIPLPINLNKLTVNNIKSYKLKNREDILSQVKKYREKLKKQMINRSKLFFPKLNFNNVSKISSSSKKNNKNITKNNSKNKNIKILNFLQDNISIEHFTNEKLKESTPNKISMEHISNKNLRINLPTNIFNKEHSPNKISIENINKEIPIEQNSRFNSIKIRYLLKPKKVDKATETNLNTIEYE